MVFGPFDYRPNVNIPPDVFASLANRYSGGYNAFQQQYDAAQQKAMERAKQTKWQQAISDLMQNPSVPQNVKMFAPLIGQYPELAGQIMPELLKVQQGKAEWAPVSGTLSKSGRPLEIDKFTGEIREAGPEGAKSSGYGATMAPIRQAQYTLQDLPSNQTPTTAGGAAYQVKVAARQGKAIIGKPGSPQQLSLAASDLARAVQRSAPQLDTLQGAGYSDNLVTTLNRLSQRITADPTGKDVPKIRRQIYDLLDDLDKTATPWITNQLDAMEEVGFKVSPLMRKRELGLTIPDVPFVEGLSQGTTQQYDPDKEARYQAWRKANGY